MLMVSGFILSISILRFILFFLLSNELNLTSFYDNTLAVQHTAHRLKKIYQTNVGNALHVLQRIK